MLHLKRQENSSLGHTQCGFGSYTLENVYFFLICNYLIFQIAEIISRFERKGFKLVAIKVVVPSKSFAQRHYHDLKERPFFDGLCDFLSSGPVVAMVRRSLTLNIPFWSTCEQIYLFIIIFFCRTGLGRRGRDQIWQETYRSHRSTEIRTRNHQR